MRVITNLRRSDDEATVGELEAGDYAEVIDPNSGNFGRVLYVLYGQDGALWFLYLGVSTKLLSCQSYPMIRCRRLSSGDAVTLVVQME